MVKRRQQTVLGLVALCTTFGAVVHCASSGKWPPYHDIAILLMAKLITHAFAICSASSTRSTTTAGLGSSRYHHRGTVMGFIMPSPCITTPTTTSTTITTSPTRGFTHRPQHHPFVLYASDSEGGEAPAPKKRGRKKKVPEEGAPSEEVAVPKKRGRKPAAAAAAATSDALDAPEKPVKATRSRKKVRR